MSVARDSKESKEKICNKELRKLPSVEQVLISDCIQIAIARYSRTLVILSVQTILTEIRSRIMSGGTCPQRFEIFNQILQRLYQEWSGLFSPIINGTGVILHTNIGRAPLSDRAVASISDLGKNYCNLEYDLPTGKRGVRAQAVEKLLCVLTGAEGALVVNNNSASVFLILAVLAARKEVIVSRGELVQIGGGFRIPEIMKVAGVHLREVGTTNQTFVNDYKQAISEKAALLLKVHTSNFAIRGFTHSATTAELKTLAREYDLPLVYDIGSGALMDTASFGLEHEPTVQEALTDGADI
ncbi:MAG: L-seryl-tRNA(Sec) selenium transferase, partial [Dehalococcoidales bacterium]|nr:L-seryl-tRNA(Sec) selenium transferase [Dehalococcoidales bacterium]